MYFLAEITINRRFLDEEKLIQLVKAKDKNSAHEKADNWAKEEYCVSNTYSDAQIQVKIRETI